MKIFLLFFSVILLFGDYFYSNGKKIDLKLESFSRSGIKYYKLPNGEKVGVNNYILVKFKANTDVDKYLTKFNLKIIKKFKNNLYLLKTPLNEELNISNQLYNFDDVVYSHPDFIHQINRR